MIANDGKCTLREAVIAANTDTASGAAAGECPAGAGADTIVLPAGTFLLSIPPSGAFDATSGELDVTTTLTIIGAGEASTIIDASLIHDRIFRVSGGRFTLSQVRLQNGYGASGGGIEFTDATGPQSLSHMSVLSSSASAGGGGIFAGSLTHPGLVMTDVLLSNNSASVGGGYSAGFLSASTFTNVTLTNNVATFEGGGIQLDRGTLVLNGSNISGNQGYALGAGISDFGVLTVTNGTFAGNILTSTTGMGGAIYVAGSRTASLNTVAVMSNSAPYGGGIYVAGSALAQMDNITFFANAAPTTAGGGGQGGALYNAGTTGLTNATLSGNHGGACSGIVFHNGPGLGGALYNLTGTTTLINSTVAQNCMQNFFTGASVQVISGSVKVKNSIFDGNSASTCNGTVTSLGHNLEDQDTCSFHQTGDLTNTNPLLGPLQTNGGTLLTHALQGNSPAIDVAENVDCPAFDERGYRRPVDGNRDGLAVCDMGAYELWLSTFLPLLGR